MTKFKNDLIACIRLIQHGKVVSYGQVAAFLGTPRAAREVGWVLHTLDGQMDLPWWRVVNNQGRISIKGNEYSTPNLQRQILRSEGLEIDEDYTFIIEKYRYGLI